MLFLIHFFKIKFKHEVEFEIYQMNIIITDELIKERSLMKVKVFKELNTN
jgi:hypothetical protein